MGAGLVMGNYPQIIISTTSTAIELEVKEESRRSQGGEDKGEGRKPGVDRDPHQEELESQLFWASCHLQGKYSLKPTSYASYCIKLAVYVCVCVIVSPSAISPFYDFLSISYW